MDTAYAQTDSITSGPLPGSLNFDPSHFSPILHVQEEWDFDELTAAMYINGYHKERLSMFVELLFPPPTSHDTDLSLKEVQTPSVSCYK